MRVVACLFSAIVLVAAIPQRVTVKALAESGLANVDASQGSGRIPSINSVRLKGKKLVVTGEGFDDQAVIAIDGAEQRTNSDSELPGERLVAPKAGKFVERNKIVGVRVNNSPLIGSDPLYVVATDALWLRVIRPQRFTPTPSSLNAKVGDYILFDLQGNGSSFFYIVTVDSAFFQKAIDPPFNDGAQLLYRVAQSGTTAIRIEIRY